MKKIPIHLVSLFSKYKNSEFTDFYQFLRSVNLEATPQLSKLAENWRKKKQSILRKLERAGNEVYKDAFNDIKGSYEPKMRAQFQRVIALKGAIVRLMEEKLQKALKHEENLKVSELRELMKMAKTELGEATNISQTNKTSKHTQETRKIVFASIISKKDALQIKEAEVHNKTKVVSTQ